MLGGYIYGPIEGGVLNLIGRVIGQFLAFAIAFKAAGWMSKRNATSLQTFRELVAGDKTNLNLPDLDLDHKDARLIRPRVRGH